MNNSSCNVDALRTVGPLRYVEIFLYSIAIFVGLVGNLLLLLVLIKRRKLRFASDVYFMNTTVVDIIITGTLPLWIYYELSYTAFDRTACISLSVTFYVPLFMQAWLLISIAMERYSSLVWMAPISRKGAVKNCLGTWVVCTFVASPYYAFRNSHEGHRCILGNYNWHFNEPAHSLLDVMIIGCTFASPVIVMLIVSYKMKIATWGNRKLSAETGDLILLMAIVAMLFWGPFHIVLVIDNTLQRVYDSSNCTVEEVKHLLSMGSATAVYLRAVVNPIIYFGISSKFREQVYSLFRYHPYADLDLEAAKNTVELRVREKNTKGKKRKKRVTWFDETFSKSYECFL
ncbi:membrane protein US27E [Mandrillus leucophaeus cytomegalovirus]|uniref:Membrane protein US27E n=1 Tax=Mandrillus leucophaeus cytomegalovirus TaxID=1654930 RepID=A0A0G2UGH0_9BETA|nr:membrane protein US27E [Mandrillus leucophaeus cytomegalovirus]AKI29733.1 membrane protein US27E [Mandrillus leucophaeus cytomegalovirus]